MRRTFWLILSPGVILLAAHGPAWAQDNSLDRIVDLYANNARRWEATLAVYALQLFWILAGIEFAWSAIRMALKGADLGEWLGELVNQIIFIGFFLLLLTNSATWARAIVDSFRQAASAAAQANGGAGGIAPSDIFDIGVQLASRFGESASLWSPMASVGLFLAGLVIIICFALIAAFMIMALIEAYVVISAGVIFMGFGGSRWTKDFATRTLVYAVSVGAKLFVLQLLVSLGAQVFRELGASVTTNTASIFVIIGSAIVMFAVTKTVPEMVQGLINGSSVGSGGALVAAATGTVAGAAASVIGGGMMGHSSYKLASEQLADADAAGTAPQSAGGRAAWVGGAMAGNVARALVENIGDRISGRSAIHGTRLGQASSDMSAQARKRRESRAEPPNRGNNGNNP
jgi:type IV secretion system protein TrbL